MKIWSLYRPTGQVECIDECAPRDARELVRSYRLAFSSAFVIWAGLKRDCPIQALRVTP